MITFPSVLMFVGFLNTFDSVKRSVIINNSLGRGREILLEYTKNKINLMYHNPFSSNKFEMGEERLNVNRGIRQDFLSRKSFISRKYMQLTPKENFGGIKSVKLNI